MSNALWTRLIFGGHYLMFIPCCNYFIIIVVHVLKMIFTIKITFPICFVLSNFLHTYPYNLVPKVAIRP